MVRRALLLPVALAACVDTTGERTARDLDETGWARVGPVGLHIDQGLTLVQDPARGVVRFRASAPAVVIDFASTASTPIAVTVEVENVAPGTTSPQGPPVRVLSAKAVAFDVVVPPGAAPAVRLEPPGAWGISPFRVAWVGDVQGGNATFARLRALIDADPTVDFVVFAGDISQQGTREEIERFMAVAEPLVRPWYSLLGNHESGVGDAAVFQALVGRINVVFDWRGARFVLLDSSSGTLDPRVWSLLDRALPPGEPRARILGTHIPPFDPSGLRDGGFASHAEAAKLYARLAEGGADLVLAGHLHTYAATEVAGIPTVVSGNGGVGLAMKLDGSGAHYLEVDVDPVAGTVATRRVDLEP